MLMKNMTDRNNDGATELRLSVVMRGLDPRIHRQCKKSSFRQTMDRRVEPGDDAPREPAAVRGRA
ncbi:MAG: hypothetical protein HXX10_04040 [Rhodoplanes sp.]|uniref:hypothetical protein n=1 Tax=Rhodoplanes sp. TaxID=1968906 RepID=UPI0017BF3C56|nr:hypothetical protein [Rhodoplanes sp.]NVO13185.1 hypothetical protein [Rhodoplanes sp.]